MSSNSRFHYLLRLSPSSALGSLSSGKSLFWNGATWELHVLNDRLWVQFGCDPADWERHRDVGIRLALDSLGQLALDTGIFLEAMPSDWIEDDLVPLPGGKVVYGAVVALDDPKAELQASDFHKAFEVTGLTARNAFLRRALDDYRRALGSRYDQIFYLYRAVESVFSHFADRIKRNMKTSRTADELGIDLAVVTRLANLANAEDRHIRHAASKRSLTAPSAADISQAFSHTRTVIEAFESYLRQNLQPLQHPFDADRSL